MTATAKELKQKIIDQAFMPESGINYPKGSMGWMVRQAKIYLLNDFCEALCREQREICAEMGKEIYTHGDSIGLRPNPKVLNAQMPEL